MREVAVICTKCEAFDGSDTTPRTGSVTCPEHDWRDATDMDELRDLEKKVEKLREQEKVYTDRAKNLLTNREVRITDEYFNGQPYGRSRRKLKGTTARVWHVGFQADARLTVMLNDYREPLEIDGIELI